MIWQDPLGGGQRKKWHWFPAPVALKRLAAMVLSVLRLHPWACHLQLKQNVEYICMSSPPACSLFTLSGAWLLPAIPSVVASASGGIVAQATTSPATAARVALAAGILWSLAVPLAVVIITAFFVRLATCPLEPRELVVTIALPVGPLAMAAEALLHLRAALRHAAAGAGATPCGSSASCGGGGGSSCSTALGLCSPAVAAALALWGAAAWWVVVAATMILSNLRRLEFSLGW